MRRLLGGIVAAAVLLAVPAAAVAQSKTISSGLKTETGTIEAIDASSRTVTLKKPDGTYVSVVAGPEIQRFPELKIGDKVNAKYYENLVIRVMHPGEAETRSASNTMTPANKALPGGTKAKQVTISATISAIDPETPSITFTGQNGWKYTSRVEDKAALATVKVGDKVEIVWTQALLVSMER